jgi:hypothetical protein
MLVMVIGPSPTNLAPSDVIQTAEKYAPAAPPLR